MRENMQINIFLNKVVALKNNKKIIVVVMNKTNQIIDYNILLDKKIVYDSINSHSVITYEIS